jgi:hypothetical protein
MTADQAAIILLQCMSPLLMLWTAPPPARRARGVRAARKSLLAQRGPLRDYLARNPLQAFEGAC